jgi:hypothetical protein
MTCPNGCDLDTFGTHQGPPDCDLGPADPRAMLATGVVYEHGKRRVIEVVIPGPLAEHVRRGTLDGLSIAPQRATMTGCPGTTTNPAAPATAATTAPPAPNTSQPSAWQAPAAAPNASASTPRD